MCPGDLRLTHFAFLSSFFLAFLLSFSLSFFLSLLLSVFISCVTCGASRAEASTEAFPENSYVSSSPEWLKASVRC